MVRCMFAALCVLYIGCGDKEAEKSSESSTPQLGQQRVGEKCGKVEDCAVGLTCGPDFKCIDPNPNTQSMGDAPRDSVERNAQARAGGQMGAVGSANRPSTNQTVNEAGPTVDLGELRINLRDPAGDRMLMTKIHLELDSEASRVEVEQRIGPIRYALTRLLSEQKSSDCVGQKQMETLRKQMLRRANSRLNKARITEVWPTEWIVD